MKKLLVTLLVLSLAILLVACGTSERVDKGAYILTNDGEMPSTVAVDDDDSISIVLHTIGSQPIKGSYVVKDGVLTFDSTDGAYHLVFAVEGTVLVLDAEASTDVGLRDGSRFVLEDKN